MVLDSNGMANRSVRSRFGAGSSDPRISTIPRTATEPIGDTDHQKKFLEWRPSKGLHKSASAFGKALPIFCVKPGVSQVPSNNSHPLCNRCQARMLDYVSPFATTETESMVSETVAFIDLA